MANKFIMLECNRLRASTNYKNIDEEEDEFKNEWTNNVNSYGIVCNAGDVITCESSAINTVGASDTTIEFLQKENKNGYLDNQCQIEFGYYVCDSGSNLVKLPLGFHLSSVGKDHASGLFRTVEQITTTSQYLVRNRMVGENFFEASANYNPNNPPTGLFDFPELLPQSQLVYNIELDKTGTTGTGYRVNGLYSVPEQEGVGGEGMVIKVLEITSESTTAVGIPTQIEIHEAGSGYEIDSYQIGNATDGGSNPTVQQGFKINSYINTFFRTRNGVGATGKKYYFPQNNYTGMYQSQFDGQPTGAGFALDKLNDNFQIRSSTVNLEVPNGLNTPDNIGAILTDQLANGKTAEPSDVLDHINYEKYTVRSVDFQDNPITIKPPIVESPMYKAMPSNGQGQLEVNTAEPNTFAGCRQIFYNKVGYLDPHKLKGLQCFNTWYYGLDNNDIKNQINTGSNQIPNLGNFATQTVGNLGQFTSMMIQMDISGSVVEYPQNGIILTNIYYREDTLKAISEGFRECEEYYDDLTKTYRTPLDTNKFAVNMDLGRYLNNSASYPLSPSSTFIPKGQRMRVKTPIERWNNEGGSPNGTDFEFVDQGVVADTAGTNQCVGNIPFRSKIYDDQLKDNDGQQLSQLVVRSRFDPTLYYDPVRDNPAGATPDTNIYQKFHDLISNQGSVNQNFYTNPASIDEQFINSYTEPNNNITYKTVDLIAMAKKYDLAVIPIFPPTFDPANPFNPNNQNRPFIAFFSRYELGDGNMDNNTFAGSIQKFRIDSRNCPYGIQMGYDGSPQRNPQALFYNTNFVDKSQLNSKYGVFNPVAYMGAVNPSIKFSPVLSRFQITGLNTPMTIGNGLPTDNQANIEASGDPEQQCYNVNTTGQITDTDPNKDLTNTALANNTTPLQNLRKFALAVPQLSTSFVETYSGMGILKINLLNQDGKAVSLDKSGLFGGDYSTITGITAPTKYPADILEGTLLGKMGFKIGQLIPEYGSFFAEFKDPVVFLSNIQGVGFETFNERLNGTLQPMSTSAVINPAEYQPSSTNSVDMPLYDIGTNMGLGARPAVVQASITAQDLPTKLDYPYLLIYSSIIQGGTNGEYYGGVDGKSKLPCVGYITRNYNNGDFFYSLEQSFNYTCSKSFTLTEIKTEIRLPDGSRPRLQPHNSVIYKITKPLEVPEPLAVVPPQDPTKKKKQGDGDMP